MRGWAAAPATSPLPAHVPCSLLAPSVCLERAGPPGSEPAHGQLTWAALPCSWAQGRCVAALHQECPGDLVPPRAPIWRAPSRPVAPRGLGGTCRGGGQWHPEGRTVPAEVEASGTRRVGQCPQRWRPVAPESQAVPTEVEASGHQRVRQCPQRRLPSGPLTVCLPAQSTRTAWLLRVGPLGACGRTDHEACLWPPGRRCGPGLPRPAAGPQDLVDALFLAGRFCVHDLESQPGTTPGPGARGALSPRPPTAFVRPRGPVAVPGARGQHRPGPSRVLGEGKGPPLWWSLVCPGLCKKSLDTEWAGASGQALQESPPR